MASPFMDLPHHLVSEIGRRLPVSDRVSLCCACKSVSKHVHAHIDRHELRIRECLVTSQGRACDTWGKLWSLLGKISAQRARLVMDCVCEGPLDGHLGLGVFGDDARRLVTGCLQIAQSMSVPRVDVVIRGTHTSCSASASASASEGDAHALARQVLISTSAFCKVLLEGRGHPTRVRLHMDLSCGGALSRLAPFWIHSNTFSLAHLRISHFHARLLLEATADQSSESDRHSSLLALRNLRQLDVVVPMDTAALLRLDLRTVPETAKVCIELGSLLCWVTPDSLHRVTRLLIPRADMWQALVGVYPADLQDRRAAIAAAGCCFPASEAFLLHYWQDVVDAFLAHDSTRVIFGTAASFPADLQMPSWDEHA